MERPFLGCEQDADHVDRCMFDVLVWLDRMHTMNCCDEAVIRFTLDFGRDMHLCHLVGAYRQLASWARVVGMESGEAIEHVLGWQVDLASRETSP